MGPEDVPATHGGWTRYWKYGCRCRACTQFVRATMAAQRAKNWATNGDQMRLDSRRRMKKRNDATVDRAYRSGYQWTGPELEIICRPDLTVTQMASMVGRSYSAVVKQRQMCQIDPRKYWLAGVPSSDSDQRYSSAVD